MTPGIKVHVVDEKGMSLRWVHATYRISTYTEMIEERMTTDEQGVLELPRHREWASLIGVAAATLKALMPHSGFRDSYSYITIDLDDRYDYGKLDFDPTFGGFKLISDSGTHFPGDIRIREYLLPRRQGKLEWSEGGLSITPSMRQDQIEVHVMLRPRAVAATDPAAR